MPVIHGGGSVEISFDAAASRPQMNTVEPKVCEWCSRQFFRPVPVVASVVVNGLTITGGEKFCPACRVRMEKRGTSAQQSSPRLPGEKQTRAQ